MAVNITIIGLGKIGASVGLALEKHTDQIHRIGHDYHPEVSRQAQRMGALDKIAYTLPGSVAEADIVFLALPVHEIEDTLKYIVHDLKEGAVVMDTSPVKSSVAEWAKNLIPPERYYVGLTPVINPKYLLLEETGTTAAREDMFQDGLMGIIAPSGTVSAAIKLAADLTSLLGSKPLFMDIVEVDSLVAATHLVPQLLSAGLVGATVNQPGWSEGRKIAGAAYAQTSAAFGAIDPPDSMVNASIISQEHVLRVLDNVIRTLVEFKAKIEENDAAGLTSELTAFLEARQDWLSKKQSGEWDEGPPAVDIPTSGDEMRRWIIGKRRDPKN